eukprot:148550-Hanusia_phi.AAC.1
MESRPVPGRAARPAAVPGPPAQSALPRRSLGRPGRSVTSVSECRDRLVHSGLAKLAASGLVTIISGPEHSLGRPFGRPGVVAVPAAAGTGSVLTRTRLDLDEDPLTRIQFDGFVHLIQLCLANDQTPLIAFILRSHLECGLLPVERRSVDDAGKIGQSPQELEFVLFQLRQNSFPVFVLVIIN